MLDFANARRMMVDCQLRTYDVNSIALLAAMEDVPRERFVPAGQEDLAYSDGDIQLVGGDEPRFMLPPMVLARLIQGLEVKRGARVLDVACGFGYAAAVLSRLGASVVALESQDRLADEARARLAAVGAPDVAIVVAPLDQGFPNGAPYDAILVNGAVDGRPERLLAQLSPDQGRLACIEGRGRSGRATLYLRSGDVVGSRALFDAAGPSLQAFRVEPGFVF
jgi:protein-L-isoaspartate(D-aspartate) O-methyltransferase